MWTAANPTWPFARTPSKSAISTKSCCLLLCLGPGSSRFLGQHFCCTLRVQSFLKFGIVLLRDCGDWLLCCVQIANIWPWNYGIIAVPVLAPVSVVLAVIVPIPLCGIKPLRLILCPIVILTPTVIPRVVRAFFPPGIKVMPIQVMTLRSWPPGRKLFIP